MKLNKLFSDIVGKNFGNTQKANTKETKNNSSKTTDSKSNLRGLDALSSYAQAAIQKISKEAPVITIIQTEEPESSDDEQIVIINEENSTKSISNEEIDFSYIRSLMRTNKKNIDTNKGLILKHLQNISKTLENKLQTASIEEFQELSAKKAVVDYMCGNIHQEHGFYDIENIKINLPIKPDCDETTFTSENFNKSVKLCLKEGIIDASELGRKDRQFDSEEIMEKYDRIAKDEKFNELERAFNPMYRLTGGWNSLDPYLSKNNPEFYRIISPKELNNLLKTITSKEHITSNGYFTNGNYSCITTNPNYNEQAFSANGLPIRLKFKTMNEDGTFNVDLLNRIGAIKSERSIYKVCGYNFDDIDWENVCIQDGYDWRTLNSEEIITIANHYA